MFQEDDYLAEMASPSSSSVAETILPTPDQPYSSRRSSLASPQVMDPAHHDDGDRDTCCPPDDSVAKDRQDVNASTSPASSAKPQPIISVDRAQRPFSTSTSMSNRSIRNASNPNPRAPPPPPILLRRPTDIDSAHVEDIPLRTGSSGGAGSPSRSNARGLNIAGLAPVLDGSVEPETREEQDALHALPVVLPSPRRPFFAGADNHGAPKSPAWQSFEVAQSRAPASPNKGRRQSTELPFSPLGPNANVLNLPANPLTPSRFDPTPQHGIHARNMSLFFPTPGQPSSDKLSVPPTPNFASAEGTAVMQAPHAGSKHKMPFGGSGEWTFGRAGGGTATGTQETSRSKRRGHHHKHSLSHNFFSFLDPTQTNPALARSPSPAVPSPRVLDTPQPVPMPMLATPHLLPGSPTLIPLPPSKNNPKRQLLMSLSAMECLIGAALWIEGQISGWRCLAGIGYLVVFDGIGVAVGIFERGHEAWRSVRRPYGFARLTALLYFTQSLFLVFAAVYIAKESLESVVLGADAHEHGHTEISEGADRPFPRLLLLVAACTTSFAGSYLGNHQKLVDAVGPLFLPYRYMTSLLVKKGPTFLGNPFSVTTTGMCSVALLGSVIVPSSSIHTLDSSLSLALTILTVALSYPSSIAFAHVLLQTAPPVESSQMKALKRAMKEIEEDRRVLGLGTTRCWTIGAGHAMPQREDSWSFATPGHSRQPSQTGSMSPGSPSSPLFGRSPLLNQLDSPESPTRKSHQLLTTRHSGAGLGLGLGGVNSTGKLDEPYTPLVVNLTVHVHPEVSDRDVLEVTRMAWTRIDSAVGGKGRIKSAGGMGEVTVGVVRGWEDKKAGLAQ